ncbi:MAG TPA: hypothetical protein VFE05_03245 [Longimicrobiaceae bacterium]|jgi:hypothetical protein|nr:hypothetical protein [Longimicrobiaceae bacterium]
MSEHLHNVEFSESDDTSIVGAKDAAEQPRRNPAGDAIEGRGVTDRVLTLVCESCGKDYFFDDEPPPAGMSCAKCGGTVFRSFESSVGDEAADDFRDSTERDLDPDDAEGDVMPGDIIDLERM